MEETEKKVLDRNMKELVSQLILTEDFKAELRQRDLFPDSMLQLILAEKTGRQQVYKMLELLPTRGPSAFGAFLAILEKDYAWLRDSLQADLDEETARLKADENDSPDLEEDHDVRSSAARFLHKRFGQSRKISEKDKRAIEKWLVDYVQGERNYWKGALQSQARCNARSTQRGMVDISSRIEVINLKVETCLVEVSDEGSSKAVSYTGRKHLTPEEAVLYLDNNINIVREKLRELQHDVEQCQLIMRNDVTEGLSRAPKLSLNQCLRKMKNDYELEIEELRDELESSSDKLRAEIETITKQNLTLMDIKDKQSMKQELLSREVNMLRLQNNELMDKCARLDKEQIQHLEKEKTIANLKSLLNSLQKTAEEKSSATGWQVLRGNRSNLTSQRTRRRILTKVNKTYLADSSPKPASKTVKKQ